MTSASASSAAEAQVDDHACACACACAGAATTHTRAAAPLWCTVPAASAAIASDARTSAANCCASPRTFGKWAGRHGLAASLCKRLLSAVVGGGAHERPRPLCSRPWASRPRVLASEERRGRKFDPATVGTAMNVLGIMTGVEACDVDVDQLPGEVSNVKTKRGKPVHQQQQLIARGRICAGNRFHGQERAIPPQASTRDGDASVGYAAPSCSMSCCEPAPVRTRGA